MSATMLKIEGIGNLGRDPEMRYAPNGNPVCSFSVACTRTFKNAQEEKIDETTWVRISVWGKLAENCNQYLHKGSKIHFEGRLNPDANGNPRIWQKNDGTPGANFEVTANSVLFLSGRGEGGEQAPAEESSEDIPF